MKDVKFTPTGENRPPQIDEWFRGYNGQPVQATINFTTQNFLILKMEVMEVEEVPPKDGCTAKTI